MEILFNVFAAAVGTAILAATVRFVFNLFKKND